MAAPARRFSGIERLARGAFLGGACLLLTLVMHAAGGGSWSGTGVAAAALVALLISTAVADRRRSPAAMAAYVVGSQLLLHALLAISAPHGSALHELVPTGSMLAAHLLAALALAALVGECDSLLHRWLSYLTALCRACPELPAIRVATPAFATGSESAWIPAPQRSPVLRRGPPSA